MGDQLVKSKTGRIVSKKASARAKKAYATSPLKKWMEAMKQARKQLNIKGFCACGGKTAQGKALYAKTKSILSAKSAMKAMKPAMKAMKAKKAMKVSKTAKGKRARAVVFAGSKEKTSGGMTKDQLVKSKTGRIVSKKASAQAKKAYATSPL